MNTVRQPVMRIRPVSAGRGLEWWRESFSWLFASLSNFGIWLALTLFLLASAIFLSSLAFLGSIAATLMWYFLWGGLMRAAQRTAAGEPANFADLAAGFGPASGPLAGAAILQLLVGWLVTFLVLAIGLGAFLVGGDWMLSGAPLDDLADGLVKYGAISIVLIFLALLPLVPLQMAEWLTPALVVLGATPLGEALRLSFAACCRNWQALFVYSLVFLVLGLLASVPLLLGWLVLLPLSFLSSYAAYRDMFDASLEVLDAAPAAGA